jgi:Winged helix DNA-binding domain
MKSFDIANQRLHNQRLASPGFKKPRDVVKWLGAIQAQDYYGAKWAIGQRTQSATDDDIETAFASGEILRTHVMRPTWHFVTPTDIRWLLKLTAARVNAANSSYYRKLELDDAVFDRSNKAIARALQGGKHLTRDALRTVVNRAGIGGEDLLRFNYMLIRAELDGLICSGPRNRKQFTYALLDERVPQTKTLSRDEALAELTRRYFASRGPATSSDFAWGSGLTASEVRQGLELVKHHFVTEVIEGKTYWLPSSGLSVAPALRGAYLLSAYDEYLIAYKNRSAAIDPSHSNRSIKDNAIFGPTIVWNGRVVGCWNRKIDKSSVTITVNPLARFSKTATRGINDAVHRYGQFLKMPAALR